VETEAYAVRVIQMGEEPWRVHTTGSLNLDNLKNFEPLSLAEIKRRYGLALSQDRPPLLVTFHPVTREYERTRAYADTLLKALSESGRPIVFTYPNADTNGRIIIEMIRDFVDGRDDASCVPHFGIEGYYSMMSHAAAMLGNSSSGIIEAASFKLPVVNIGRRQEGRFAPRNVLSVGTDKGEILEAIAKATSPQFRKSLNSMDNPYGDGHAAERIVAVLRELDLQEPNLIAKPFHDLPQASRHRAK
jgi:UDP-N-acetylglucosamine 2-epimerase (non-hydrolysing)/GDP/UDP-N,N'-diacetylbacillosamine 2-epimerase (hydrolysing)